MLSLLVTLLILLVIFAVFWWILSMIPIPPQFKWDRECRNRRHHLPHLHHLPCSTGNFPVFGK